MTELEPFSICTPSERPRPAYQEIADLLAGALLRLHAQQAENSEAVRLGFEDPERVNANPYQPMGVRP